MFLYCKKVFLKDTDATGVIYFTSLFQYAQEAFEAFLHGQKRSLDQLFLQNYLFPIVHAEADYKVALQVGEDIQMEVYLKVIGKNSFSVETKIIRTSDAAIAGKVTIVHAFLIKGQLKSQEIPADVLCILEKLKTASSHT